MRNRKATTADFLIAGFLFLLVLAVVVPFINTIAISFSTQREYLKLMQEAYNLYSKKEYKKASSTLNLILDIFPVEVLAERDILKIRCFSKTMASNEIQDIIVRANDIWERYSQVVMIGFAHLGEIKLAREIESDTLRSLSERLNYDDTANKRLNIIKRVSNSIHNIDVSAVFVKDAFV